MQGILENMADNLGLGALIEKSAQGDEASLRSLSTIISRPLFPYLMGRTGRKEDAMDALQDTLVDVWQSLSRFSYKSDAAFFRFVFTIGKRKLARIHAMRIREEPLSDTHDVADMDSLSDAQHRIVMERAIHKLPEKDRDIVSLRYWSEFSFSDIAKIMAMSEGAVRVRHHRALRELENILSSYATH